MPWIELHQSLPTHKKLLRLTGLLNIKTPQAIGHLALLWLWTLDNGPEGDVSCLSPRELAQVCQFPVKRAGELRSALIDAGLLDAEGEKLRIHDWADYGGKYQRKRDKDRERKRKLKEQELFDFLGSSDGIPSVEKKTKENKTKYERKEASKEKSFEDLRAEALRKLEAYGRTQNGTGGIF